MTSDSHPSAVIVNSVNRRPSRGIITVMSDASLERAAFLALRARPSRELMVAFLRAHQGRIFRLCYQVLHNVHDAEDAAQSVLLKIVGEVRWFGDPNSFRRWLYRVSLNAALETARKAARRRDHEARSAMHKSVPKPLEGATRLALFEALADLDEPSRNLLLEHYFEGESLQSIADREGCSAPAVCKRMDHARESLRRRLGGAGGLAALPNLEALFPPGPVTPDLVTGAVLAQAESATADLAAGGIAMASKTTTGVTSILSALAVIMVVLYIGITSSRGSESVMSGKKDGAWPGDAASGYHGTSAAMHPVPAESTDTRAVVSEGRRRLLELFGRRYPEWRDKLWRTRRGGWSNARDLMEDKAVSELAEWIVSQGNPDLNRDLITLYRSSKSDLGTFALILLTRGRHPDLEGFFSELLTTKDGDYADSRFAAWGLSNIESPGGLDLLLERLKSTLSDPKGPDYVYMHALGRTGGPGLDRLLALAQDEVASGRISLTSLQVQTLHLAFFFDPRIAARLRELAATHLSPEIRFLATIPLLGSKQGEELAFAFGRLRDDADPVLREKLSDQIYVFALVGALGTLPSDLKRELVELMRQNKNFHPHALLRAGPHFDPDEFLPALRDQWAGLPEDSRLSLLSELAQVNAPEALQLLEEFALAADLTERTVSAVAMAKSYSDPRVAERLLDFLNRVTDTSKSMRASQAVEALARFPADQREAIAIRLGESLPGASRTTRLAILSELWRFGERSEAPLLKIARTQGDGIEQLAAWNALSSTDGFARRLDLANEAKAFLTRMDPNLFGDPPDKWRQSLAGHYLNLLTRSFMAAGTAADIPVLERMAENPRVPFSSHPEIVDLFRRAARTAVDAIRLRVGP